MRALVLPCDYLPPCEAPPCGQFWVTFQREPAVNDILKISVGRCEEWLRSNAIHDHVVKMFPGHRSNEVIDHRLPWIDQAKPVDVFIVRWQVQIEPD